MNESKDINPQYSIRECREGDEERNLRLRDITLDISRDIRWWRWIYKNGPDGPAISWLADDRQKMLGHHALLPLRMKIGDGEYRGSLGFDVMTHPDYQRQGILTGIRARVYRSAAENDIRLSFGSALPQIFPVYTKLHSFFICEPPLLVKIISLGKVMKRRFRIPAFIGNSLGYIWGLIADRKSFIPENDIEVEQVSSFDESFDKFWLKASEIKKIMVVRNRRFLNWRYVEKPGDEYVIFVARRQRETLGYVVLRLEKNTITRGFVIDILTLPDDDMAAAALIHRAVKYSRGEGAAIVSCLMLRDAPYYRVLRKLGFMHRHSRLFFGVRRVDENIPREFLTEPSNWYYTWGDTDTR